MCSCVHISTYVTHVCMCKGISRPTNSLPHRIRVETVLHSGHILHALHSGFEPCQQQPGLFEESPVVIGQGLDFGEGHQQKNKRELEREHDGSLSSVNLETAQSLLTRRAWVPL